VTGGSSLRRYRLAVIGCGRPEGTDGATGFGMGHMHVRAFEMTGRCKLVAAADLSRENVEAFAVRWGCPATYVDYGTMLAETRPEIVSICAWPRCHPEMVVACAEAGVKAVHCEKPMAATWADARRMVEACERSGTQLTINHQNRFRHHYQAARDLIREAAVGELRYLEGTSSNLRNSHWVDLLFFFNEETPAEWVMAQIDGRRKRLNGGESREETAVCYLQFANHARALLLTGADAAIGCIYRLVGTDGTIEVHGRQPRVRIQSKRDGAWRGVEVEDTPDWQPPLDRAIADVVAALEERREPELSARRALRTMEVIFAAEESSRRGGRIDLPLPADAAEQPVCYDSARRPPKLARRSAIS